MPEESTTPDRVELVRRVNEAWNSRDFEAMSVLFSSDVVYRPIAVFTEAEECRGFDECRRFFEGFFEAWADDFRLSLDTIRLYGDAVVARCVFTGHARSSGVEISERIFEVSWFRDGQITRLEDFTDRNEAVRAAEERG